MAWRDSRRARLRLLLFSCSIMAGIAALVAIGSLRDSLLAAMENEARGMLGGDVYLNSKRAFTPRAEEIIKASGAKVQREVSYTGMARAPKNKSARLIQLRAVDPDYPFFGKPITDPPDAWARCLAGEGCVSDATLAEALSVQPGDTITAGSLEVKLLGILTKPPPQVSLMGAFAPELFIARNRAEETKMAGGLGFTFHRAWLVFPDNKSVEQNFAVPHKKPLRAEGLSMETLEGRKKTAQKVLSVIYSFLSLMAFIALVLGGLGIAGAIHVHALERLPSVATLRCLGCPARRAMAIYVLQALWLGLAGSLGGLIFGALIVRLVPYALHHILPIEVETSLSGKMLFMAPGFGFLLCVCFALLPLLKIRQVPPMAAVRANVTGGAQLWRDPMTWLLVPTMLGSLAWLAMTLSPDNAPLVGLGFTAALCVGLGLLAITAWVIMRSARALVRPRWPFTMRQGLAGLYRPRNQTLLFLLSVGLGVSLILSTLLTQSMLLRFMTGKTFRGKANFFVMDVPVEKLDSAAEILRRYTSITPERVPVAMARLAGINGRTIGDMLTGDDDKRPSSWLLNQIYRVGISPVLPVLPISPPRSVPVSLEDGAMRGLRMKKGDTFELLLGEHTISCHVKETHTVSWENILGSFPILFPSGALDEFPHSWVMGARLETPAASARVQRELTAAMPGITVFDVAAMTRVFEDVLDRGAWLVRGLCLLTVLTGGIIVLAVLLAGRRDRIEESVLLRTLGASRSQIRRILLWEYFLLGIFAATTGALLAAGYAWLLAKYVFKIPFDTWHWPLGAAVVLVAGATAAIGMLLSRGVASHPPLAILRGES